MIEPPANLPGLERPLPDCPYIYDELRSHKKVSLTLMQLWIEYKERYPEGYEYTQFCEHYRRWLGKRDYVMRQEHRAGEKRVLPASARNLGATGGHAGSMTARRIVRAG